MPSKPPRGPAADITRYVFMSSCAVYGEGLNVTKGDPLASEDHPDSYIADKVSSERALFRMNEEEGFRSLPCAHALNVRAPDADIWTWDFERETMTRLTSQPGLDGFPAWTPDGDRIVFIITRQGLGGLSWMASDGTGTDEEFARPIGGGIWPGNFSPDGTELVFHTANGPLGSAVASLTLGGSPTPLVATEFPEKHPHLSPDGRWLAYQSAATGKHEIYVRPFPNVDDGLFPISSGGGTRPVWSPTGRELFYVAPGRRMMTVPVETEPRFVPGDAEELFVLGEEYPETGPESRDYDISPDGDRFLILKDSGSRSPTEFFVVVNWHEELKERVPTR